EPVSVNVHWGGPQEDCLRENEPEGVWSYHRGSLRPPSDGMAAPESVADMMDAPPGPMVRLQVAYQVHDEDVLDRQDLLSLVRAIKKHARPGTRYRVCVFVARITNRIGKP